MTEHITGAQARELLDGTTPAPWEAKHRSHPMRGGDFISISPAEEAGWMKSRSARTVCEVTDNHSPNAALITAAPVLAETVEWLYGREPDREDSEGHTEWEVDLFLEVSTFGGMVYDLDGREFSPGHAVEYARALLAAAETARRLTD